MHLSVGKQTKLQGLFRSSYCNSKPKEMQKLLQAYRFPRISPISSHQRLFANTRHTNVCVCVTELLCLCLGGSQTYRVKVVISGGGRVSTIAWLCFLFVLDRVIFLCNGCEKASEIGFL